MTIIKKCSTTTPPYEYDKGCQNVRTLTISEHANLTLKNVLDFLRECLISWENICFIFKKTNIYILITGNVAAY